MGRSLVSAERRDLIHLSIAIVVMVAVLCGSVRVVYADEPSMSPSVLIVDSNLGDAELCSLHWLGSDLEVVAEDGAKSLVSSSNPVWWNNDNVPATFLLKSDGAPLGSDEIVWALDAIRDSGANPHTFVVAMAATGLPVREYLEDLASVKYSDRADVVGVAFLGAPHNGYSASTTYSECGLWGQIAGSVGISSADLMPGSDYLERLNAGKLPNILKSLELVGTVGDMGFGQTDGAGTSIDLTLSSEAFDQVEHAQVNATVGRSINLTGSWMPYTNTIDYADQAVDAKLVEQLSAMECYETTGDVQDAVREFFEIWFANNDIVTHSSHVVLLDLSGSMREKIDGSATKLDAARQAAKEYLHAMSVRETLSLSAPTDVVIIGFSESVKTLANDCSDSSIDSLDAAQAVGETDMGQALDAAMDELAKTPTCASRHILLMSDGASTQGQSESEIMNGAVARAKELGVAIDTIGFGDAGESNAGFLQSVSEATGGEYYTATDTYSLRVDFLKSYYSSFGSELVEEQIEQGKETSKAIRADKQTQALEFGIVLEDSQSSVALLCDGEEVDSSLYTIGEQEGMVSLRCLSPIEGEYSVRLAEPTGKAHLFAARQQGISSGVDAVAAQSDHALLFVGVAGVALVVLAAGVAVFTRKRSMKRNDTREGNNS